MKFAQLNMLMRLGRDFGHEQIRDAGFTDTEHAICTFLCFHELVSQDRIANALMLDKTTVAKALSSMERKGLIRREQNAQNRRENSIQITAAGRASVSTSIDIYDAWLKDVCSCLSEEESQRLDAYLDRMLNLALERHNQKNRIAK
ncbi:hypothetical protein SDC9_112488 [bioreactor metagenome]|uniref:HTH marR-type domain-containing protein n=1 Tax=bioreactor metagenome TaxID=1076179 RepID=A0A645BM25_9ZZZZ|nr:MarR family transcriptional regulator [Christensenella sp.]